MVLSAPTILQLGFESQAHHLCFFNSYCSNSNWGEKRTIINEKEARIGPYLKFLTWLRWGGRENDENEETSKVEKTLKPKFQRFTHLADYYLPLFLLLLLVLKNILNFCFLKYFKLAKSHSTATTLSCSWRKYVSLIHFCFCCKFFFIWKYFECECSVDR